MRSLSYQVRYESFIQASKALCAYYFDEAIKDTRIVNALTLSICFLIVNSRANEVWKLTSVNGNFMRSRSYPMDS